MTERQAVAREEVALPLVEVEDLSKIFDVSPPLLNRLLQGQGRALLTAVDHVSFRIPRGTTRSEEHTSELQSLMRISYAVFCLKKKNTDNYTYTFTNNIRHT